MNRAFFQALTVGAAMAFLAGCSASSIPLHSTDTAAGATGASRKSAIFDYTGAEQTFIVPAGVTRLTVSAHGGIGDGFTIRGYNQVGFPGRVYAVIRVHPGETLYVFVGGQGSDGGFNGGGAGGPSYGTSDDGGGRGGGASDVRRGGDKLKNRILVAAGGGGSGAIFLYSDADGGDGGGLVGEAGYGSSYHPGGGSGGGGGTQIAGGAGGAGGVGSGNNGDAGTSGALGLGGNGGNGVGSTGYYFGLGGGGGGGGYYGGGGGGGGSNWDGGGGGGGSSYVEPGAITSHMWTGWRANGDGRVAFSWK